jgi:hypothetical protein
VGRRKLLSVFEPSTEIIRKGKAGKPGELAVNRSCINVSGL